MAQTATMGPPLSPREPRRSGRRSLPNASTGTSKSPDSEPPPKQKETQHRPPASSNNGGNGRNKRVKHEGSEEPVEDRKIASTPSTSSSAPAANSRNKRKPKEKEKSSISDVPAGDYPTGHSDSLQADPGEDEEEQGITRCVCGSTGEDDPDAGEFMVQCETCKVWQHGLCMGYESEDQLHDDDYYCEMCRPELHADLLKKLQKRARQSSTNANHTTAAANPRLSRSRSPTTLLKQPTKRRNTMNSRDAAFDESLKEIIEATAAEAAVANETASVASAGNKVNSHDPDDDVEVGPGSRKRRKRGEEDNTAKKRMRSASTASDHQSATALSAENSVPAKVASQPAPAPKTSHRSNKRGGRKGAVVIPDNQTNDSEEAHPPKRQNNGGRTKGTNAPKRPPVSHSVSHGTGSAQQLLTSWNLPDYLSHLEEMLPSETPRPLEIRTGPTAAGTGPARGESIDLTVERGVKVKWPSKRMSVGDMNKRVRALVEWVGREQASALDRMRRKESLEKALKEEIRARATERLNIGDETGEIALSEKDGIDSNIAARTSAPSDEEQKHVELDGAQTSATMKLMEELMEELISFQERFGPGAKSRERRVPSL